MKIFEELYNYFKNKLGDKLIIKSYKQKQNIFFDASCNGNVYIVKSGKVEINKCTLGWEERIIFILSEGYILNEDILFSENSHCTTNARAFTDVEIFCINKNMLREYMQKDFKISEFVLYNSSMKLKRAYRQLKNSGTNVTLEKKIISKLWKLSLDYGIEVEDSILIDVVISSSIIAKMIGAKRESVSRKINALKKKGIIDIKDDKIVILKFEEFYELLGIDNHFLKN